MERSADIELMIIRFSSIKEMCMPPPPFRELTHRCVRNSERPTGGWGPSINDVAPWGSDHTKWAGWTMSRSSRVVSPTPALSIRMKYHLPLNLMADNPEQLLLDDW